MRDDEIAAPKKLNRGKQGNDTTANSFTSDIDALIRIGKKSIIAGPSVPPDPNCEHTTTKIDYSFTNPNNGDFDVYTTKSPLAIRIVFKHPHTIAQTNMQFNVAANFISIILDY
ncbi:hypothetical protein Tcan_15602 [Toxocara canis]|uniref:Uncharacterized protein n=1 Tax=Toxocara canis TaxID=6265 RepID=A0A0B2VHV3_TOXCA|nr:hypothetical protein Tcan_15602 [Toxocara canis]